MRYIKLSWYNSRWFDNYLNHWVQPDAIIPDPYNPLDWDRYAYCRKNPVNYTDPTGHFPWLLAVVGAVYVGYEVGVASGLLPDYQGIARAESAVGRYKAIEVTAGLAVQGQYAGPLDDLAGLRPGSSGYGLAQTNAEEINALGLSGSAYDPAVAAQVMQARIENAQAACHNCTAKDMLIVAALAQNKGISPTDLDGWSRTANGGGIAWEDIFRNSTSKGQFDAEFREKLTGIQYENYFMIVKYVKNLRELYRRGWDLPEGITEDDLDALEEWASSNGQ